MILAVDVGNSRAKWAMFDERGEIVAQGVMENGQLETLADACQRSAGLRHAVVSMVAATPVRERLADVLKRCGVSVKWVMPQAEGGGVINRYAQPGQLGPDRWAAAVAAWQLHHTACIVVNAGTALTVDALSSSGEFLGGLIVPGLRMMQRALKDGTAAIGETSGAWRDFPTATGDAVYSGSLAAMAGAVVHMHGTLAALEGKVPMCLCSGGDAALLLPHLGIAAEIEPDLVLKGLFFLERMSE